MAYSVENNYTWHQATPGMAASCYINKIRFILKREIVSSSNIINWTKWILLPINYLRIRHFSFANDTNIINVPQQNRKNFFK